MKGNSETYSLDINAIFESIEKLIDNLQASKDAQDVNRNSLSTALRIYKDLFSYLSHNKIKAVELERFAKITLQISTHLADEKRLEDASECCKIFKGFMENMEIKSKNIDQVLMNIENLQGRIRNLKQINVVKSEFQKGILDSFSLLDLSTMQEVINGIDFKEVLPDVKLQNKVLKQLTKISFTELRIRNCAALDNTMLSAFFKSSPQLMVLEIPGCENIKSGVINDAARIIASNSTNLEKLDLSHTGITYITPAVSGFLNFPNLRQLTVDGCANLSHIQIDAPHLVKLHAENCTQLKVLKIKTKQLATAKLTNCPIEQRELKEKYLNIVDEWKLLPSNLKKVIQDLLNNNSKELALGAKVGNLADLGFFRMGIPLWVKKFDLTESQAKTLANVLRINQSVTDIVIPQQTVISKGEGLNVLLETLTIRSNLELIDFSLTHLGKERTESLVKIIKSNSSLAELNLSWTQVDLEAICRCLQLHPVPISLDLGHISEENVAAVVDLIDKNPNIKFIQAAFLPMSPGSFMKFSSAIARNKSLLFLNLSYSIFPDQECLQDLANALKKNRTLLGLEIKAINFSSNKCEELIKRRIFANYLILLCDEQRLKNLLSQSEKYRGLTFMKQMYESILKTFSSQIPVELKLIYNKLVANQSDFILDLKSKNLDRFWIIPISLGLELNNKVTSLDFSDNKIDDECTQILTEMLEVNTTLTSLNLSNNLIGEGGMQALVKLMENNKVIISLNVDNNKYNDIKMKKQIDEYLERNNRIKNSVQSVKPTNSETTTPPSWSKMFSDISKATTQFFVTTIFENSQSTETDSQTATKGQSQK